MYSEYFLVMNPDVIFHERFDLEGAILEIHNNSADISSSVIFNSDIQIEDYKRENITPLSLMRRHIAKRKDYKFDWFSDIFLIFSSEVFNSLNGFDTKYFMYVEDWDICMRVRPQGLKLHDLAGFSATYLDQRESRRDVRRFIMHFKSVVRYWLS